MNIALNFHRIIDTDKQITAYEDIPLENFTLILNKIHSSCLSLDQLINAKSNDISWLLTFDDGFYSDYELVLPLLIKYKINAIFFIVTSFVGQPNYMTWEQIRSLSDNGMVIGSHSVNHRDMKSISKSERAIEFDTSRSMIEDQIEKKVTTFSFPYGRYNTSITNEAFKIGYEYCFTSKPKDFNENDKLIPRVSLNGHMSKEKTIHLLDKNIDNFRKQLFLYYVKDLAKYSLGIKNYWLIRNLFIRN